MYNKPCIIATHEETENYLAIPRGCLESLMSILNKLGVNTNIVDKRNCGAHINADFDGQLREEQSTAYSALSQYDIGVLSATTAFGKTVIGAKLISDKKSKYINIGTYCRAFKPVERGVIKVFSIV